MRTSRLLLRTWRDADYEPFAALSADPRVAEHLAGVLTRDESNGLVDRIREHWSERGFGLWAVELRTSGALLGFAGLSTPRVEAHFMPCVEVGWRLASEYWGRGFATEAARAAVASGFQELELDEIVAMTVPANARSIRVMEKLGMTRSTHDDFDHPRFPEGHRLRRHVLYRLARDQWSGP